MADFVPHNLPLQLSSFIGREREIAEVTHLLLREDPRGFQNLAGLPARLVTLTGAGGCGKTRLALQVAAELTAVGTRVALPPRDGVWFIPLAALSDPALVPQQIAAALEVREQTGQPLLATLTNYLREKDLLLLLDNCEHLLEACKQVAQTLLPTCPQLHILATSREVLNVAGELTYRVPSLEIPKTQSQIPLAELAQTESIRLFIERATSVHPYFALTDKNATAVAHICQRLDGIPLALELAAARVKVLAVEQIAARLDDALSLLTRGSDPTLRHQTMRAALDWSHELLSESERVLFRRLAVFAGSWDLEAAEQVCALDGHPPLRRVDVLDVLTNLIEQSLVLVIEHEETARYRLLEPIRQYARDKLNEAKERQRFEQRHLEFFARFAVEAAPQLHRAEQQQWYRHVDADYDNLRAAIEWAAIHDLPLVGLRLSNALAWYWEVRSLWREGFDHINKLLAVLEQSVLPPSPEADLLRADALGISGHLAGWMGSLQTERWRLEESIALARQVGAPGRAIMARRLVDLTHHSGDREGRYNRLALDEAARLAREAGADFILARAQSVGGLAAQYDNDFQTARRLYEDSVRTCHRLGERIFRAPPLSGLTQVAMLEGDLPAARRYAEEQLTLAREQGDSGHWPIALRHVGEVALLQGHLAEAREALQESLVLWRKAGNLAQAARVLRLLGGVAHGQNRLSDAATHYLESLQLLREQWSARDAAESMIGLAFVAVERKLGEQATHWLAQAEALMERANLRHVPNLQPSYNKQVEAVRTVMSRKAFAEAWREGRALTQEQIVAETERSIIAPVALYPGGLTEREIEVLRLVARGLTNQEIADQLVVSRRTVHAHMRSIFSKLDVTTRTAAARYAAQYNLV
jgi:non-specific serine/threonine protein kinase